MNVDTHPMTRPLATVATEANECAAGCRFRFPRLHADSSRYTLIEWLLRMDPNGCYTDEDNIAEYGSVLSLDDLWWFVNYHVTEE